jgi:hypothetical protein
VSAEAWPHVQGAEQATEAHAAGALTAPPLWERSRATKALDAELSSPQRLGAGVGCWLLGVAGVAALAAAAWHGSPAALRVVALVAGTALVVGAFVASRPVVAAGRRVVSAFCWWQLLPRLVADQDGGAADWGTGGVERAVDTRAWYLHPRRLALVGLMAGAFLAPLALLRIATSDYSARPWPEDQSLSLTVAVLGGIVVSWYAGGALFRSMSRAGSAQGQKDPVTQRLLGRGR